MKFSQLIQTLQESGVKIGLSETHQLVVRGAKDALTSDMKAALKANKHLLIEWLQANQGNGETEQESPINVLENRQGIYPMSFSQKRLWFIDKLQGQNAVFNLPATFRLQGQIQLPLIQQALQQLMQRHESIRTLFFEQGGEPVQYVLPQAEVPFVVNESLKGHAWDDDAVQAVLREDAFKPFALEQDLKMRALAIALGDDESLLQITLHHISADGMSMGILVKEFNQIYTALAQGEAVALPAPELQYLDFAQWQGEALDNKGLEPHINYWKDTLQGAPKCHSLPLQKARPEFQSYAADKVTRHLDANQAKTIESVTQQQGATLFMAMVANLSLLVNRYSGERDMVFGTPTSGRFVPALAGVFGLFVNNLVLRMQLPESATYAELLAYTKKQCLDGYTHQQVPFETLVEQLAPERNSGYNPIFQISLAMQNLVDDSLSLPGVEVSDISFEDSMGRYDLSLLITDSKDGITLKWLYNTTLFERDVIDAIADDFNQLLTLTANAPETPLADLPVAENSLYNKVLSPENGLPNGPVVDAPENLLTRLYATAKKTPDAVAISSGEFNVSYEALVYSVDHVAAALVEQGIAQGDKVSIILHPGLELIIATLAVQRLNAAYVPIDPSYPAERIQFQLQDSQAKAVIAESALNIDAIPACLLMQDLMAATPNVEGSLPAINDAAKDIAAYVIYTSGSTGKPKGVEISQYALAHFIDELHQQVLSMMPSLPTSWLWSHAFAFDASLKSFALLASGTRLVFANPDVMVDPAALIDVLKANDMTLFNTIPSVVDALLNELNAQGHGVNLIVSGDAISPASWKAISDYCDAFQVKAINAYGPTETTVNASYAHIGESAMPVIGRPMQGHQIYVVDGNVNPVPIGAKGEIAIAGPGVAMAYLNREALYKEKFVANPFSTEKGLETLYLSGDMGAYLPSGEVSFLGRKDRQVKVRGFRVELDEIDALLQAQASVENAYTWLRPDATEQIITFVVLRDEAKADDEKASIDAIHAVLAEQLPAYMQPNKLLVVEAFEKTIAGKVDAQKMLDANALQASQDDGELTPTEQSLLKIWRDLLENDSIGVNDKFFEIGGHSLMAMKVSAEVRKAFGVSVAIRTLLTSPTVRALAQVVDAQTESQSQAGKTEVLL